MAKLTVIPQAYINAAANWLSSDYAPTNNDVNATVLSYLDRGEFKLWNYSWDYEFLATFDLLVGAAEAS